MSPRPSRLLVAVLFAFPATAPAQGRWREIGKTSIGNIIYVDPKSVKTANGIVTAFVRVVYVNPAKTPKGNITAVREIAMFDCRKRLVGAKEITIYLDEKTNRIYSHEVVAQPGYGTPMEGTFAPVALEKLCAK